MNRCKKVSKYMEFYFIFIYIYFTLFVDSHVTFGENDIQAESVLNLTDNNISHADFYEKSLSSDSQSSSSYCPNPRQIAPCSCTGPQGFLYLICDQLSDEDELKRVLSTDFPVSEFGKLSLTNSNIPVWSEGLLKVVSFEYIYVYKTSLIKIFPQDFVSSKTSIKRLEIIHNDLQTFPFNYVSTLNKLEQLILYYNAIKIIPDHAFGLHTKLKEINLSFNMIHYVGSYAFENLRALKVLNLRYNKLFILNNYAFAVERVNPNLLLDLSNNYIIYISEEAFRNQVPKLLNISYNHLKSLSKSNFENMLQTMTVENYGMIVTKGNRFLCTCENSAWLAILPYMSKQHINGFVCSDLNINLMNVTFKDIRCTKD
ncbi:uncharacterized protein LOC143229340 [Tachypleus tridentatus]|uniref:uncharacterized protein LOC143229340 n=1 Tax=Tachypleus tridentatus TaxID=6853 RepID=UPI003FD68A45